jgi:hypothetical protein
MGNGQMQASQVSKSNFGTSSGNAVTKTNTTIATPSRTNTNPQTTTQTTYQTNGNTTTTPPVMNVCNDPSCVVGGGGGDTGGGTGGTDNTQGGGDCDKEPQKCAILTNISNNLDGVGNNGELVLANIQQYQDDALSDYQTQVQGLADDFLNSELFTSEITDALIDMPSVGKFLQEQSENGQACSISFDTPYGTHTLNLCPYQSQIHAVMAFGIFILLMISLRNMFLDRKSE